MKTIYNNLLQIEPEEQKISKRQDLLGTTWKWLEAKARGSPDAQDLRIINSTTNELIIQNNQQFDVNDRLNKKIYDLTKSINKIINSLKTNEYNKSS